MVLGSWSRALQQVLQQVSRVSGCRVLGAGDGIWGCDVKSKNCSACRGLESGVWGLGCGVWGQGCGVWGVGCGVWG